MVPTAVVTGSGTTRRVLAIAEDDAADSIAFRYSLEAAGYEVQMAGTGAEGLRLCADFRPDLILLDINLPDMSGLDLCRTIRSSTDLVQPAIIVVTDRTEEADRIAGFGAGADDFVAKPFSLSELLLRIRARLLSRLPAETSATTLVAIDEGGPNRITLGPLEIDKASHRVYLMDNEISLSVQEMRLLIYLAAEPGKMRTRRELLTAVWGYHPDASSRTLDTHIKRLRDKFGPLATMIQTAHGVGYRLTLSAPDAKQSPRSPTSRPTQRRR